LPYRHRVFANSFVARSVYIDVESRKWVGLQSGGVIVKDGETWTNLIMSEISHNAWPQAPMLFTGIVRGNLYWLRHVFGYLQEGGEIKNVRSFKRLIIANGLPSKNVLAVIEGKKTTC
jgi:hypothetical protein